MKKRKYAVLVVVIALAMVAGYTASTLDLLQKSATLPLSGQQVDVLTVDAGAPAGLNTRGEYLFDSKGNLISHQVSGSPGIVTSAFQGSVGAAFIGAGGGAGLAAQGAAKTTVGITNTVAGSTNVNKMKQGQGQVGINTQAQGQAQGQLQGQAQGQLQNQGQLQQDHPTLSPGTVF